CGQYGITVNAISPGGIETDMSKAVMTAEYRERRLRELPLRRFGSVDDVAYCAVVLASEDAGYLTGQILHPRGGGGGGRGAPPAGGAPPAPRRGARSGPQ